MAKKTLFSFELEPGMIIAEDVYRANGTILFPKHTMLNELMISKLSTYNIMELPIEDGPIEKPELDIDKLIELARKDMEAKQAAKADMEDSYVQKLKAGAEYKNFCKKYDAAVSIINELISSFIKNGDELNTDTLIANALSLMEGSTIHIFDMLHNMPVHDDSIYEHSMNVALISATIGKWLKLPETDINGLLLAGLLHDLGKTEIPAELLNKRGRLTDEEFAIIKSHPKKGYELIRNIPLDVKIKEACLLHHERCDGSGYPFGVPGNKISSYAKILAIADVYDAMTSPRSYRQALCPFKAIEIFEQDGFYKYDLKSLMTFLENIGFSYLNNSVLLSDGRKGEIVILNKLYLSKPMVKCGDEFVDLSKFPDLTIETII